MYESWDVKWLTSLLACSRHTGVRTSSMKAGTVTRARTPSTARSHTGHEPRGAPSAYSEDPF